MGFLAKSRERLRLRTLRNKVVEAQSLPLLIELLKSYIASGAAEDALEMADWGLRLFPDSAALRDIQRFASREHSSELRRRAPEVEEPTVGPEPLLELAQVYRLAGKDDEAVETLQRCVTQFPYYGRAQAELGEIYSQRFQTDVCSTDALEAIRLFEAALAADASDDRTRLALAVLFLRIGAISRVLTLLKRIVARDSEHAVAASLLQVVLRMPPENEEENLESQLVRVEERGQFAHEYPPEEMVGKQVHHSRDELIERLVASLTAEPCIEESVVLDHDRKLHGKQSPTADMCKELLPTAAMAMRRMQLGALLSLVIETDQRQIQMQQIPDGHVAIRTGPGVAPGKAAMVLGRHLESYAGWRKA